MVQLSGGIGNVTTNTGLVEMAMAYSRSRMLCAAARLGIANSLGDEVRSVGFLAENCQADADALYRLLRALASIGVTEETTPEHFRLTPFGKPLRRDVPQSVWAAVIFVQVMVKDSKKYASTGGWGFAQFNDGKPAEEAVHKTIFSCHEPAKDRDFVFTRYAP